MSRSTFFRRAVMSRHRSSAPVLAGRWKADTLGLSNGAAVTTIPDSASLNGSFQTPNGSVTYVTGSQNSLGIVRLATTAGMQLNLTNPAASQPFTLFAAVKINGAGTGTVISFNGLQLFCTGTKWDLNCGTDLQRGTQDTTFHIFTLLANGANSLVRVDGVLQGVAGNAGSNVGASGVKTGAIAGQSVGIDVGEIVLYSGDATGLSEESSLRTKWGTA